MLTGCVVPCLQLPIKKIKLQGYYDGYNTDDFIAFVEEVELAGYYRPAVTVREVASPTIREAEQIGSRIGSDE
jgi:hypothetical protein